MKKKSKFTRDILVGIITGIVSTLVISWFITPLTDLIFPKIITFLENTSMPFVDNVYQRAATFTIERTGLLNLTFSSICALFFVGTSAYLFFSVKYDIQEQLDEINEFINPTANMSDYQLLQSFKEEKRYIQKKLKKYRKLSVACLISMIFADSAIVFSEMTQIYESSLSTNARVNIEIVSPYISDQEYKQLKSDFFTIKSKSDYDILQQTLKAISEKNQLDLKE